MRCSHRKKLLTLPPLTATHTAISLPLSHYSTLFQSNSLLHTAQCSAVKQQPVLPSFHYLWLLLYTVRSCTHKPNVTLHLELKKYKYLFCTTTNFLRWRGCPYELSVQYVTPTPCCEVWCACYRILLCYYLFPKMAFSHLFLFFLSAWGHRPSMSLI